MALKLTHLTARRLFLAGLSASAASACTPVTRGQTPGNPSKSAGPNDVDVVIIGAGLSGLAAAKQLVALGYSVAVLEAAGQAGGRTKTDWRLGAPFEVGAGWIHGPNGNPISKLARDIGAPTFVTDDDSYRVFAENGAVQSEESINQTYERLKRLYSEIDKTFETDVSLEQALARVGGTSDPVLGWMSSAYTEFSTGGPLDRLSALQFDEDSVFGGADIILPQGYDKVVASLARGLDVRLNSPVSRIEYANGEGATVHTPTGTIDASFVICTAPLGVLQQGSIQFDPPLPGAYTRSMNRIGMGNVTKLALKFAEPFWPLDVQYFGLMTERRGRWNYFLNYRTFSNENILLGLSVGGYAQVAEAMSDTAMVADCMDAVRGMFGSGASDPTDHLATRWSQDPHTRGAYSYPKAGARPEDFDRLAEPIENTLLLAGEHTTFKYHGTTHGAYLSGLRAAKTLDDDLYEAPSVRARGGRSLAARSVYNPRRG